MKYGYVYIHTNLANGKRYVGQSIQTPKRRFRKTQNALNSYKSCPAMYAALVKYGWDVFSTEIVYHAFDQEGLNVAEEFYINLYSTADGIHGYNTISFSQGRGKQADSTKEKISEKRKIYMEKMGGSLGPAANRKEHKTIDGVEHKHCSGCDKVKPLTQFNKYTGRWDGLHNKCAECQRNIRKTQYSKERRPLTEEEWKRSYVNRSEAMSLGAKKAYENNPSLRGDSSKRNSKKIKRIDLKTGEVKIYNSGLEAKAEGFDNTYVSQCCNGHKASYLDYKWEFFKEDVDK